MGQTAIQSDGLAASSITRSKLNTSLAGNAVIAKVLSGTGITIAQTGVDAGTGDVTPAVDQTFAPNWTGLHRWTPTANAGVPLTVNGDGTHDIADFVGATGSVQVQSSGNVLNFSRNGFNYITATGAASTLYVQVRGTSVLTAGLGVQIGAAPTGGDKGAGTLNVATGYYVNGVALATGTSANPSASVGLTAVNGVAGTLMTSDSAPALSQAIAPTWTGAHTWTVAGTATGITLNNSGTGVTLTAANTSTSTSNAAIIASSSSSSAAAIRATNGATGGPAIYVSASGGPGSFAIDVASGGVLFGGTGLQLGSPTGADEGNGTINVASGYYLNGVNQFQTGTFTGTLVGLTTSPTVSCSYAISGSMVTLTINKTNVAITGTSNSTAFSMTGLPAAMQPSTSFGAVPTLWGFYDNGVVASGTVTITAGSGTITFYKGSSGTLASWTGSGTKGISSPITITYNLN
jgi:hypothetical protein